MALPVLYENRIKFYSSLFQTFFHTETTFHADCAEVKSKLDDICENLSIKSAQQAAYAVPVAADQVQEVRQDSETHTLENEHPNVDLGNATN